jgi:uncharacterized protein (TIGR03435 family)
MRAQKNARLEAYNSRIRPKMRVAATVAIFLVAGTAVTQTPTAPRFEVASIKLMPQPRPGRPSLRVDPSRLDARQLSLAELIQHAYSVPWYQIVWKSAADSTGRKFTAPMPIYDVAATMPAGTSTDDVHLMLQSLLADRLNFRMHRENRDMPVYAVRIAPGGLRVGKADPPPDQQYRTEMAPNEFRYHAKMPLSKLIELLRLELDRPMVDLTKLADSYDIDLRWPRIDTPGDMGPDPANMATLFSAMEKQLGLLVEARKMPLDMLVIDRVDRVPTEN